MCTLYALGKENDPCVTTKEIPYFVRPVTPIAQYSVLGIGTANLQEEHMNLPSFFGGGGEGGGMNWNYSFLVADKYLSVVLVVQELKISFTW